MQFLLAIFHAHAVTGVDDPDDGVSLLEVIAPVGAEGALAADVPCRFTDFEMSLTSGNRVTIQMFNVNLVTTNGRSSGV